MKCTGVCMIFSVFIMSVVRSSVQFILINFDNPASPLRTRFFMPVLGQGVVTYTSPVEAFATGIKNLDRRISSLIAWSLRSEALDRLILQEFKGQNIATPAKYLRMTVMRSWRGEGYHCHTYCSCNCSHCQCFVFGASHSCTLNVEYRQL